MIPELGEPVKLTFTLYADLWNGDCVSLWGHLGAGLVSTARAVIRHRLGNYYDT